MSGLNKTARSAWAWVPSLYFAEGIPYVVVMTLSVIMYQRLGISNSDIALYTSWLYLPWVIKPFWSPLVDLLKTKRWWIIVMQLIIGVGLGGVALTIPVPNYFQYTLLFFWLLAFSSATHDIAADGFYMLGLDEHEQAYFIGIRSTFYRLAMITGQGLLIILAGFIEMKTGLEPVQFNVSTRQGASEWVWTAGDEVERPNDELQFILSSNYFVLGTDGIENDKAKGVKAWASQSNINFGFVGQESDEKHDQSWWSLNISSPLKEELKKYFNQEENVSDNGAMAGNIAVVGIHLSAMPDEEIILNLDRLKGAKDLKLIEGQRLAFNSNNWNRNAYVLVQADDKLDKEVSASFRGLSGNIPLAWMSTFIVLAFLFIVFTVYHRFYLPKPLADKALVEHGNALKEFASTFISFFQKKNIGLAITFILVFRLGESQLVKIASLFLLDTRQAGGLGLTAGDVGLIYGTIGILFLTLGGIIGGWLASKRGLKYWIWPMALAMNLPNLTYVYLSYFTPENMWLVAASVAVEQFGYGFGFTAFMLYLIYFSEGKSKTAHYAICTGFMALGMMIPGMFSGWLQEIVGYQNFFIWVMLCTLPGFLIIRFLNINPSFGIKKK